MGTGLLRIGWTGPAPGTVQGDRAGSDLPVDWPSGDGMFRGRLSGSTPVARAALLIEVSTAEEAGPGERVWVVVGLIGLVPLRYCSWSSGSPPCCISWWWAGGQPASSGRATTSGNRPAVRSRTFPPILPALTLFPRLDILTCFPHLLD